MKYLLSPSTDGKISPAEIEEIRKVVEKEGRLHTYGGNKQGVHLTDAEKDFLRHSSSDFFANLWESAERYNSLSLNQYVYVYQAMAPKREAAAKIGEEKLAEYRRNAEERLANLLRIYFASELSSGKKAQWFSREVLLILAENRTFKDKDTGKVSEKIYLEAVDKEWGVIYSAFLKPPHLDETIPFLDLLKMVGETFFIQGKNESGMGISGYGEKWAVGHPVSVYGGHYGHAVLQNQKGIHLRFSGKHQSLLTPKSFKESGFKVMNPYSLLHNAMKECSEMIKRAQSFQKSWNEYKMEEERKTRENAIADFKEQTLNEIMQLKKYNTDYEKQMQNLPVIKSRISEERTKLYQQQQLENLQNALNHNLETIRTLENKITTIPQNEDNIRANALHSLQFKMHYQNILRDIAREQERENFFKQNLREIIEYVKELKKK